MSHLIAKGDRKTMDSWDISELRIDENGNAIAISSGSIDLSKVFDECAEMVGITDDGFVSFANLIIIEDTSK
jgi:hypothetical protein